MNFYNEIDPKAAAWLRELIRQGFLPPGVVDERSIADLKPHDLIGFTQCHFFAGIGGWSLALFLAGIPTTRKLWTGSCPCQPFSDAGLGLGTADSRHLWPVWFKLILQCRPELVLGEQVASKAALGWLDGVFLDLEGAGYACAAADLCAAGVGAPHIRQRLYWVANADGRQRDGIAAGKGREPDGNTAGRKQSHGKPECGGAACGLADAENAGCERRQDSAGQTGRSEPVTACGLEHATGDGRQQRRTESGERGVVGGCRHDALGLGYAQQPGLEGHAGHGYERHEPGRIDARAAGPTASPGPVDAWSRFSVVHCTDGKARRFEPGSFPLAHGVSGRVGLLRGYGNAIVPELAAEFIQAAEEASAGNPDCGLTETESVFDFA